MTFPIEPLIVCAQRAMSAMAGPPRTALPYVATRLPSTRLRLRVGTTSVYNPIERSRHSELTMDTDIRVALIGLDTSHTEQFSRRMPANGLRPTRCLAFVTPFQDAAGIAERTRTLEGMGVEVTDDFDRAIGDCDAVMVEINDPSLHLEYFRRCAGLGKPVFVDKPLADTIANGRAMVEVAAKNGTNWFSCSPLRFAAEMLEAANRMRSPHEATAWGPLGKAPAGSSIVWYGVHVFEMLNRLLGRGAKSVHAAEENGEVVAVAEFADGRRARAQFTSKSYGGTARDAAGAEVRFDVTSGSAFYGALVSQVAAFFRTGTPPVALDDTIEIMAMLDAGERSYQSGRAEPV
ncbi:MAG: gfo/Idh/MocA family oxidoreductase [Spirochaetaceae bacterium]|nr:MAG: gfo/Idh/MocA family oxidoreductase [Spirochaetaceae bacterium]